MFQSAGEITDNYKEICAEEQKVSTKNPGHKGAFQALSDTIRQNCVQFNNELSAVKVLMPKVKAAAKGKAAGKKPGNLKEEIEE